MSLTLVTFREAVLSAPSELYATSSLQPSLLDSWLRVTALDKKIMKFLHLVLGEGESWLQELFKGTRLSLPICGIPEHLGAKRFNLVS